MNIQINNLPKSTVELTIEIKPEEYQSFLENTAKQLSKNIKIKGFRPGTAPYKLIKEEIGETEILNNALNDIVTHTFVDAIQEKKLNTIGSPEINITKMAAGNNLIYKAKVIILPEIKLPDLNAINIKKPEIKIEDKEITQLLNQLAKSRATEALANRPSADKDLVKLDYNISIAGVPQENGQQKNLDVYLGDSHMVPGFEKQIIGLKKDDTKKFDIKFPDDYFQKNFAGKTCQFDVKINGVYQLNIPVIDNQFAQSLGKFKNLDELKSQIKNNLNEQKLSQQNKQLETEILNKIIEKTKFDDLPDKIIDNEIESILNEFENDLSQRGLELKTWLANMKKDMEQFKKDLRPQAETRVKSALIIRQITQQEKIEAKNEEVEAEIQKLTEMHKDNNEALKQIKNPAYKNHLANIITGQKTMEWLKEKIVK